jgi:uncharacterized protein
MASHFVWYELMTTDTAGAEAFYKTVIGWKPEPMPGMPYTIMKVGDTGVAGMMTIPEEAAKMGQPPAWVGYIYADDVDAQTESVGKAGGTVHRAPEDIPTVGRFSVVADPQGAVFMLFKPQGEDGTQHPAGTPGTIGWRELYAKDWKSAFDFYASQFGWKKDQAIDMGEMGTYQLFTIDDEQSGGMMDKPAEMPVAAWAYYFNVEAIDAAAGRVTQNNGKILNGPMEVPGGSWIVNCVDPQGAMFSLVAPRR